MTDSIVILGLDPGLRHTGWGLIRATGNCLSFVAVGVIAPPVTLSVPARLAQLADEIEGVVKTYRPDEAAVEKTFMNGNAASALKLGEARGIALMAPARAGLYVAEYAANLIKKTVTGYGHADKTQMAGMIGMLLPAARGLQADAADALAIAICHAQHRSTLALAARVGQTAETINKKPPPRKRA